MNDKFYHGVRVTDVESTEKTVVKATSGIPVAVGTAPVHKTGISVSGVVLAESFTEAAAALGYSDDWEQFTLCEVMDVMFRKFGVGPVLFINVADPKTHKETVEAAEMPMIDGQVKLPETAIKESITVKNGDTALEAGTDYEVFYHEDGCIVAATADGNAKDLSALTISYDKVSITKEALKDAVIGGTDTETGEASGMELIDDCHALTGVIPDIILAPGISDDPAVAAVMEAKTKVCTLFRGRALIDGDCEHVKLYSKVPAWKKEAGINSEKQILCWPMARISGKQVHLSTVKAARMAATDSENGNCPSEPASNKEIPIDALVLADGTEVTINLDKANYLNSHGIVTALNFVGGFRLWGNYTACYPEENSPEKKFISAARTKDWLKNSVIKTIWTRVDGKLTRRWVESICDDCNIWFNGLVADSHLYGARVELVAAENTAADIEAGRVRPHFWYCPVNPGQEIEFLAEYDGSYLTSALS